MSQLSEPAARARGTRDSVVVIGGGLAGISAALAAAGGGAAVTLLEARPRLGGATFSIRRDGLDIDNGQHVFLRCCTAYRSLLERIGASGQVELQPRLSVPVLAPGGRIGWLRRGRLPAPLHLAGALSRYPYLTWPQRMGVARAALAMRRLDLADERLDRRSFAEWLAEHGQGEAATAALWELVGLPTLNARAAQTSLQLAAKVFKTGLLEHRDAADIGYSRVPLGRLHGEAAGRALTAAGTEVRLRCHARSVEPGEGALEVVTDDGRVRADAVVVAVPHEAAPGLLPPGALPEGTRLQQLGASPIVNLHVVYDRPVTTMPFAAGLGTPVQWFFDRSAGAGLERDGRQYLAVSLSGAADEIDLSTATLRERYLPALAELLPAARRARVTAFVVTRERTATFMPAPGTAALRPGAVTGVAGLFLAGSWTSTGWPATMEGAVRSGLVAARAALVSLGRTRGLPTPEEFPGFPPGGRRAPRTSPADREGTSTHPEVAA
jgi:squalene-associated FAD-dependent desaturase